MAKKSKKAKRTTRKTAKKAVKKTTKKKTAKKVSKKTAGKTAKRSVKKTSARKKTAKQAKTSKRPARKKTAAKKTARTVTAKPAAKKKSAAKKKAASKPAATKTSAAISTKRSTSKAATSKRQKPAAASARASTAAAKPRPKRSVISQPEPARGPRKHRESRAGAIRTAVVGLGRAGYGMILKTLAKRGDQFDVVAVCDTLEDRVKRVAREFDAEPYARIDELLYETDAELVVIATRSVDHFFHTTMALKSGRHVFVEKPMGINYGQARRLQQLAAQTAGDLYVRHNRRFEPGFQHIREIIESGILGDVYEIKLRRTGYSRRDDWQTILDQGGGQLLNWGPHIVDHALQFLDAPVKNQWSCLRRIAAVGDAEDHLKICLEGTNGRLVDLEISGGSAIVEPTYVVSGTRGGLSCDNRTISLKYLDPNRKLSPRKASRDTPPEGGFGSPDDLRWIEKTIPIKPAEKMDTEDIWGHLYATLHDNKPFPITLDQAVNVMRVIHEARRGTEFEIRT